MSDNEDDLNLISYYAVYDVFEDKGIRKKRFIANFDKLTGGEMQVTMIPYTQVLESGMTLTQFIPGQIKYTPVLLLRGFDSKCQEIYTWFQSGPAGKLKNGYKNISITAIDGKGDARVTWNLINAYPLSITGFSFNQHVEAYYSDFEITVQPEYIEMC